MGCYRAIGKFISAILTGPVSMSAQTSSRQVLARTPRVAWWLWGSIVNIHFTPKAGARIEVLNSYKTGGGRRRLGYLCADQRTALDKSDEVAFDRVQRLLTCCVINFSLLWCVRLRNMRRRGGDLE
ncbi:hypothetical protein PHLGIDRAFT_327832 [Phlebiopsis gigantea 11061_1 CR5-6]|uniref:Uncharacterized protein n=1 Tax=Phlebiopsis gigantea (strain 11061_1 CR5-6) TaxID=745531 RepID=A0A0C3SFK5_PHLG1|nr:hypothetical protein PHLGIDRAFT_327832 [Phlebiopsis gigantea 11061_1 CR5-6]